MRVVEPHAFKSVKHPKKRRKPTFINIGILLMVAIYVAVMLGRPLPAATASSQPTIPTKSQSVEIQWPSYGQASIGAVGYGTLGSNGEQKALPTASVAKVMTALAVLKQKPLKVGEQGSVITITEEDVEEYNRTIALDGSNVPVMLGEEITQYEALQALLLPSANNMAHTLARWAYGSEENYLRFVNNFAKSLGMENTNFDDPSGYSPKTVSTSQDLVKLAVNAMDNPVIAEIAAQKEADIPVAGRIYNVNMLLGRSGIVGVKTGNTEEAGGCFMAAAVREINGKKVMAVSVIMGAPNLSVALRDSVPLVQSVLNGFSEVTVAKAGDQVGTYNQPWAKPIPLKILSDLQGIIWQDSSVGTSLKIDKPHGIVAAGAKVGSVKVDVGRDTAESDVVITQNTSEPTILWRLMPRF
jgi:serine-type D-Ala-D-Ala carboxypeptidase (penicillin-binding protein 5/6)